MTTTHNAAHQPKLARQISARSHSFVTLTVAVTLLAMASSFALSFNSQLAVAPLLGLSDSNSWLLPLGSDGFILASGLQLAVLRVREGSGFSRRAFLKTAQFRQWVLLFGWTAASMMMNIWHGLTVTHTASFGVTAAVILVQTLFPLGILTATEGLMKLLVEETTDSGQLAAAKTRLLNSGIVPAAPLGKRPVSVISTDLDIQIAAAYQLADTPPTLKLLATKFGVSEARIKLVRDSLV